MSGEGKSAEETALEGLRRMEEWMKELGLSMNISQLGATPDMIKGMAKATEILEGGYKTLDISEVEQILRESL